jgi:hypothetical protein
MRTKTIRQFTREEITEALNLWLKHHDNSGHVEPVAKVNVTMDSNFMIEEVPAETKAQPA